MSRTPSKTAALSMKYRLPLSSIELALGTPSRATSLDEAYARFTNDSMNPVRRKELERWIARELKIADGSASHRLIFHKTPEDSPVILRVKKKWDLSTRKELQRGGRSAKDAHEILKNSRPTSYEYFTAVKRFKLMLGRDMELGKKKKNVSLLFTLLDITKAKERQEVEDLLVKFCRTEADLRRLVNQLASKKNEAIIIRRLAQMNK